MILSLGYLDEKSSREKCIAALEANQTVVAAQVCR